MADLVDRLGFLASGQDDVQSQALTAAADEIERLRALLERSNRGEHICLNSTDGLGPLVEKRNDRS